MPPDWTWSTGDWHYLPDNPLYTLTGRQITFRLGPGAVSEAQFAIDAHLPAIANIQAAISDLWIAYRTQTLFRGRIGPGADTFDGTTHTVGFQASDYRAMLGKRIIYDADTKTWTNVDESQVAWNLITQTQAKPGGGLGIVRGSGQTTGVLISPAYEAGASIQETIDTQAATSTGFHWDLTPKTGTTNLTFDVWHPGRGTDRGVVLTYPSGSPATANAPAGRIQQGSSQTDLSKYANALRATGGQDAANNDLAPLAVASADVATDPAGRWDGQFSDSDIKTAALLTSSANAALAADQDVTPTWTVTLAPDSWGGPADIWLGDPVTLVIRSGYRQVGPETLTVQEVQVAFDDASDAASVTLTLGSPPPGLKWNYRAIDRRLRKLERR